MHPKGILGHSSTRAGIAARTKRHNSAVHDAGFRWGAPSHSGQPTGGGGSFRVRKILTFFEIFGGGSNPPPRHAICKNTWRQQGATVMVAPAVPLLMHITRQMQYDAHPGTARSMHNARASPP